MPILPNFFFVILLAIATGYLTFLTTKGGLTDNRYSVRWWNRLTKRGKLVSLVLLIITILLSCQEWNSQNNNDRKDAEAKVKEKERDSIITVRVNTRTDSNGKKLYNDISLAFKNQELKLDTVNKSVDRIRDSARTVINNYPQKDPSVMLSMN